MRVMVGAMRKKHGERPVLGERRRWGRLWRRGQG